VEIPGIGEKMVEKIHQSVATYFEELEAQATAAPAEAAPVEGEAQAVVESVDENVESAEASEAEPAEPAAAETEPAQAAAAAAELPDSEANATAEAAENEGTAAPADTHTDAEKKENSE
jgi:hypothetical protein